MVDVTSGVFWVVVVEGEGLELPGVVHETRPEKSHITSHCIVFGQ